MKKSTAIISSLAVISAIAFGLSGCRSDEQIASDLMNQAEKDGKASMEAMSSMRRDYQQKEDALIAKYEAMKVNGELTPEQKLAQEKELANIKEELKTAIKDYDAKHGINREP